MISFPPQHSQYKYQLFCIMTESDRQQLLERRWKHQQSSQLYEDESQQDRETAPFTCKIIMKDIVIRTQHYVIYQSIRKTPKKKSKEFDYKQIAIKKHESHPRLKNSQQSAQYQFLSKRKDLQEAFDLRPFGFKQQSYLQLDHIQYTLQDKLKYGVREFREQKDQKINFRAQLYYDFKKQIIDLLNECHQRKSPIFIGSLSPASIGVFEKEQSEGRRTYSYYLLDFSRANDKDASQSLHLYDLRYLAPQYTNLSHFSDLWSFGCILYELLSNGDKLINDVRFHKLPSQQKSAFIEQRLRQLNCKISLINSQLPKVKQRQKLKFPIEALVLLRECLKIDPQRRKLPDKMQYKQQLPLSIQQMQFQKNKIVYDISMEIFRLNVLQDNIMCVFEELYFNTTKTVKKHHLYPLLKFASCVYLQVYNRAKDKAKSYARNEKWDKYSQVKRIQEEKKLVDIKDKAAGKLIKELEQQKNVALKNDILKEFPEIIEDRIANAKDVYKAYWRYIKGDLCRFQNSSFFKYLYNIHFYMQEVPQMEQFLTHIGRTVSLKLDRTEMSEKNDPELIYFQQANKVSDIIEQQIETILSTSSISQSERKDAQQRMQKALQLSISATK